MAALYNTHLVNDANLVAYYKLEDVSDSKGSYTLTNVNSVTFSAGLYGNCADFGASNTNKTLRAASNLGITTGNITMSGWIKMNTELSSGTDYEICRHTYLTGGANTGLENRVIYQYNSGTLRLNFRRNTNADANAYYTISLGTSNWYHIAYVYNGTNVLGYVNGVQQASVAAPAASYTLNTATDFSLAAYAEFSNYLSAKIDDFSVFSRALTATEILTIYRGELSGFLAFM